MKLLLLHSLGLVLWAGRLLAQEAPLKVEILPKLFASSPFHAFRTRFTNVSSAPVRIVRDSFRHLGIREKGGKSIPEDAACGGSMSGPVIPIPEESLLTIQPGQSTELFVRGKWEIPEDGEFLVSFVYSVPQDNEGWLRYSFPAEVWRGSVRAEDVLISFPADPKADPVQSISLSSLKRACEVLDTLQTGDSPKMMEAIANRLLEVGDVMAVPVLERAAGRGLLRVSARPLGRLGNEKSFPVLLRAAEKYRDLEAIDGLVLLVSRSSQPSEIWMNASRRVVQPTEDVLASWQAWWESNRAEFKIVKPAYTPGAEVRTAAQRVGSKTAPALSPAQR